MRSSLPGRSTHQDGRVAIAGCSADHIPGATWTHAPHQGGHLWSSICVQGCTPLRLHQPESATTAWFLLALPRNAVDVDEEGRLSSWQNVKTHVSSLNVHMLCVCVCVRKLQVLLLLLCLIGASYDWWIRQVGSRKSICLHQIQYLRKTTWLPLITGFMIVRMQHLCLCEDVHTNDSQPCVARQHRCTFLEPHQHVTKLCFQTKYRQHLLS